MNFHGSGHRDEPDINLIPMIDVLLVILLFLMVSTSFTQISQLSINLPKADVQSNSKPQGVEVEVDAGGHVMVNGKVADNGVDGLSQALKQAASGQTDPVVIISADAKSTHQSVVDVMTAARNAGLTHMTFATRPDK